MRLLAATGPVTMPGSALIASAVRSYQQPHAQRGTGLAAPIRPRRGAFFVLLTLRKNARRALCCSPRHRLTSA